MGLLPLLAVAIAVGAIATPPGGGPPAAEAAMERASASAAGTSFQPRRHLRYTAHAHAAKNEMFQLAMRTRFRAGAGGTSGFRLHRRHERVHMWSKPCRHLTMEKR